MILKAIENVRGRYEVNKILLFLEADKRMVSGS